MIFNDELLVFSLSQIANYSMVYKSLITEDHFEQIVNIIIDGDLSYRIVNLRVCISKNKQINKGSRIYLWLICRLIRNQEGDRKANETFIKMEVKWVASKGC